MTKQYYFEFKTRHSTTCNTTTLRAKNLAEAIAKFNRDFADCEITLVKELDIYERSIDMEYDDDVFPTEVETEIRNTLVGEKLTFTISGTSKKFVDAVADSFGGCRAPGFTRPRINFSQVYNAFMCIGY